MADFPKVLYHENGQTRTARSEQEAKSFGAGWSDQPNENSVMAIRKAAGSVSEVIEPVQRTRPERTDR